MVIDIKIIVALLVLGALLPCICFAGSPKNYIYTAQQLADIKNTNDAAFILKADIELVDWQPFDFSGTLDGAGHSISGLNSALFLRVQNAAISNLVVKDADVHGSVYVGVLANEITNSHISNVKIANSYVLVQPDILGAAGGLAGAIFDSAIKDVAFTGGRVVAVANDLAPISIGGLVGLSQNSSFERCIVKNTKVFGDAANTGGLCGYVNADSSFINCLSIADVSGLSVVGGFAGVVFQAKINNCTAIANVPQGAITAGGFVGKLAGSSRIEYSTAHEIVQGRKNVGGFVGVVSKIGAPNTITGSVAYSPGVIGTAYGNVRRFAGLLEHDGINNCHAYLGMIVVAGDRLLGVTPNAYGADGADILTMGDSGLCPY